MEQLKKDLQAVSKELKALANKTKGIVKAIDKLEKTQVKTETKPRAAKKAFAKKPAAKKATAQTATDQVLSIIKQNENGIGVPALIKETGLEDKTIRNIVFKATKEGKIERAGRGIYVAA